MDNDDEVQVTICCDDEKSVDLRAVCLVRAIANDFDDDLDDEDGVDEWLVDERCSGYVDDLMWDGWKRERAERKWE